MVGMMLLVCVVGLVLLGGGIAEPAAVVAIPLNETHIEDRGHTQALELLPAYKTGVCEGKWVGYNITTGIIRVVCGIPDSQNCLVVIYRVTENAGATVLVGEAYNCTAYVAPCYKAYSRAGYSDWESEDTWITASLDLKASIISAFGNP
jgi:hypothetical protein